MIDIHSHILAAIDDGSPDIATSLEMLAIAEQCGVSDIIATPHVIEKYSALTWNKIQEQTQQLQLQARNQGLNINIHPGAELEMNWELLDLLQGGDYCLAGSHYILIELPASMIPTYVDDFWFELRIAGYTPILAHPERNSALMKNISLLDKWKKEGLLLQCNAGSLTGLYGSTAQKNIIDLINCDYVDYIASDAHNTTRRNTDLSECAAALREQFGAAYADKVLNTAQQNILATKHV